MKRRNAMIERLEVRRMLSAAMVKDLNTGPAPLSGFWTMVSAENTVFLSQDDGVAGWELYKTDGTADGSVLVKDIRPGRDNSAPGWLTYAGNGTIFFAADDGTHGVELWKSDGTEAGTVLVKDINPGAAASSPAGLINVNGTIYFSASDGANGFELWKSDGTEDGTVMVKNIATAAGASSSPTQLINNNGVVFFRASNGPSGFELWKSNGSEGGTVQVKEIASSSSNGVNNVPMAVRDGLVYFSGSNSSSGSELWRSDGSDLGTTIVKELYASSTSSSPTLIKTSGSYVYFSVAGGTAPGLYRTDGTDPGTVRLTSSGISNSLDVNGKLFFTTVLPSPPPPAPPQLRNIGLWTTDGNTVTTIDATLVMSGFTLPWVAIGNTMYFTAQTAATGEEPWKSDGTPGGTGMIREIEPGPVNGNPIGMVAYGPGGSSGILFTAASGVAGSNGGLYRSDGTAGGTVFVKDLYPGTDSSGPLLITPFKGHVYFIASEAQHSGGGLLGELYRSDGTEAGTGIFADLIPGPTSAPVSQLRAYGNNLYFVANDGSGTGSELWRTDGSSVSFVKDINPGTPDSGINGGTGSGNYFFFRATTAAHGEELWRTDGSDFGTLRMTNNATGVTVENLTDVNGWLYFTTKSSTGVFTGLWKSDGSGSLGVATTLTDVTSMININGTLYISGTTPANGAELYKIEPGSATPVLIKDINGFPGPGNLTNNGGTLFFTASTSANGTELWESDGTEAGTQLVKDIRAGSSSAMNNNSASMVATNGVVYFRADDGVAGIEVWRSDGTAAGTDLVKDITPPGASSGTPNRLYAANGFVYFSASDDNSATPEAWRTDGTAAGTAPLSEFPKGTAISYPSNGAFFAAMGGDVYYFFTDDTHGSELWKAEQPDFATLAAGGVMTITGTANNDVIEVAVDGSGGVVVTLNGLTETFAPGQVASLNVASGIGRDTLTVSSGTIAFNGDTGAGTANLALRIAPGAAAVFNASQHLRDLDVDGVATLAQGGGKVIVTRGLSVDGRLNLKDNNLVLDYDPAETNPIAAIEARIASAYRNNRWDGPGIFTDMTQATDGLTTLAISDPLGMRGVGPTATMSFAGETIDGTSVVIKYSWAGDLNLDGLVDAQDYGVIDNWVQFPGTRGYANGDINFDGVIDAADYGIIDNTIQLQGPPLTTSSASAASVVDSQEVVTKAPVAGKPARAKARCRNHR